jgi:hypothetical protein
MVPNSDVVAMGFFIGISFMAAAVIALTVLYFTGPRVSNQTDEDKKTSVNNSDPDLAVKVQRSPQKRLKLKITGLLPKRSPKTPPPEPSTDKKLAENKLDTSVSLPLAKEGLFNPKDTGNAESLSGGQPPGVIAAPVQPGPNAVQPAPDNMVPMGAPASNITQTVSSPPVESSTPDPAPKITVSETSPPAVKDVAGASANLSTAGLPQPKPNVELTNKVEVKEMKNENKATPNTSANQPETGKPAQTDVQNKAKDTSSATDFSELFTQDEEENEVSRLAKELSDVDSEEILEESLSLINQLKRNRS